MHEAMPRCSTRRWSRSKESSRTPASTATSRARAADDRPQFTQGLTGPKMIDGLQVEGTFRAHQVPLHRPLIRTPQAAGRLDEELPTRGIFDDHGRLKSELADLAPKGQRRMGESHANGAFCCANCGCRISASTRSTWPRRCSRHRRHTCARAFLRDVAKLNSAQRNFGSLARRDAL